MVVDHSVSEIDGKPYFTISFIRNKEAVAAGYKYIVEESTRLSFDGGLAVELEDFRVDLGDGTERVTYRCSDDMAESPQCFFRIRVEPPKTF